MNIAFTIVNYVVQDIIIIFFFNQLLTPKWHFTTSVAVMSFLICSIYLELNYLPEKTNSILSTILRIAVIVFLIVFSYDDAPKRKIAVFVIQILLDLLSELISCLLAWSIFNSSISYPFAVTQSPELLSMAKIVCLDVLFVLSLTVIMFFKHRHLTSKQSYNLLFLMLIICVMHFIFLILYYCLGRTPEYEISDGLQMFLQLMIYSLIVFHYYNTIRVSDLERKEAEIERINEELKNNRLYFDLADSKFEEISRLRHDIQNELSTIKLLIEEEESIASAESMIETIEHRLDQI